MFNDFFPLLRSGVSSDRERPGDTSHRTPAAVSTVMQDVSNRQNGFLTYAEGRKEVLAAVEKIEMLHQKLFPEMAHSQEARRIFQKMRSAELAFMEHVFRKAQEFITNRNANIQRLKGSAGSANSVVLLWDIDETIADRDSHKFRSTIRPAFVPLVNVLNRTFPYVRHGILSWRGKRRIQEQLQDHRANFSISSIRRVFDGDYVFSSSEFTEIPLGKSREFYFSDSEPEWQGFAEKVQAYHGINLLFPNTYFILVDDVLQSHFEKIGAGIRISPNEQCVFAKALSNVFVR